MGEAAHDRRDRRGGLGLRLLKTLSPKGRVGGRGGEVSRVVRKSRSVALLETSRSGEENRE
jgi:hypothetical protein